MRYFKDPAGEVFGYDETRDSQVALMESQAIAQNWTEVTGAWPPAPTLAQVQAQQIAILNAAYRAAIVAPVSFKTAAGTTASFPQDDQAIQFRDQSLEAGAQAWTLNLWLDVNGAPVTPFTYADLQGLSAAMEAADTPAYQDLLAKIAQVTAATTVAAVQAITF